MRMCLGASACVLLTAAVVAAWPVQQFPPTLRDSTSCQTDIASSTAVVTHCDHRHSEKELMVDLIIVWRGVPGWFQNRRGLPGGGSGGSSVSGGGLQGRVTRNQTYGGVSINYDADFDAGVVVIDKQTLSLKGVNTILVVNVDGAGGPQVAATRWTEPILPLVGDVNLAVAQRSRAFLDDLQCAVPMPAPPAGIRQLPVTTVCEKTTSR